MIKHANKFFDGRREKKFMTWHNAIHIKWMIFKWSSSRENKINSYTGLKTKTSGKKYFPSRVDYPKTDIDISAVHLIGQFRGDFNLSSMSLWNASNASQLTILEWTYRTFWKDLYRKEFVRQIDSLFSVSVASHRIWVDLASWTKFFFHRPPDVCYTLTKRRELFHLRTMRIKQEKKMHKNKHIK